MRLITLVLILFGIPTFAQTQFSAEMVDKDNNSASSPSKIYVGSGKIRMDGLSGHPGIIIADYATQNAYILMPKEKKYLQVPMRDGKDQLAPSFAFFAPTKPGEPCAQWKIVVPDLTCRKVGSETLNGRTVEKWQGIRANGETGFLWFDAKLQFAIKLDSRDHRIEFQNLKEGTQPANLFNIPVDYKKMN